VLVKHLDKIINHGLEQNRIFLGKKFP